MTKELKGILFDFNGTLFFDSDLHMEAFRQVFPLYGLPVPTDDFMAERCFGRTNETIFKENINPNATKADIDEFELRKESIYHKLCLDLPEGSVYRDLLSGDVYREEVKIAPDTAMILRLEG